LERNLTAGGLLGYSSVNSKSNLNVPPSQGVSSGPKMTACQAITLLSKGAACTPVGGSFCNLLKSLINLFLADVDMMLLSSVFFVVNCCGFVN